MAKKIISIFFGFRKMNIFLGMKILWIFLGSSENWTIFLCVLGSFLRSWYRMGDIFGVAKISNTVYFGGA